MEPPGGWRPFLQQERAALLKTAREKNWGLPDRILHHADNGTWNTLAARAGGSHVGRQRQNLLGDGWILGVSYPSVHNYINSLKSKMNAINVAHAVALGYELGILKLRTAEPRVMMAVTLTEND
jgi:hypothetical protein